MAHRNRLPPARYWLERWDRQQEGYLPHREERFRLMFDVLEEHLPSRFTAVDLGCGPGSLTIRLLRRFPSARVLAVDFDPVLLQLGRAVLGDQTGRLGWVEADLRRSDWVERLPARKIDAVLSTTALHWLRPARLRVLYQELGRLVREGGVFLNGDHVPYGPRLPSLAGVSDAVHHRWSRAAFRRSGAPEWSAWWRELRTDPRFRDAFKERDRRYPPGPHHEAALSLRTQENWLGRAGFREVAPVWRELGDVVLAALR